MVLYARTVKQLAFEEGWDGCRYRIKLQAKSGQPNSRSRAENPSVSINLCELSEFRVKNTMWKQKNMSRLEIQREINQNRKAHRRPYFSLLYLDFE